MQWLQYLHIGECSIPEIKARAYRKRACNSPVYLAKVALIPSSPLGVYIMHANMQKLYAEGAN